MSDSSYPKMIELEAMRLQVLAHQIAKQHVLIEFLDYSLSNAKTQLEQWQKEMDKIHSSPTKVKNVEEEVR